MTITTSLHAAIADHAPIISVSIGRRDDKTTWRIDFAPEATTAQRVAAEGAMAAFTYTPEAEPNPASELAVLRAQLQALLAVVQGMQEAP